MPEPEPTRDELLAEIRRLRDHLDARAAATGADEAARHDAGQLESRHRAVIEDQRLVCRYRPDGTLGVVGDAYCRYFGRPVGDLVGRSLLSLVAEPDRERVRQHIAALGPSNPVEMIECRVIAASGEVRSQDRKSVV